MADEEKQADVEEKPKRKAGRPKGSGVIPRKNVTYKVCKECLEVKPASEFYVRKENKDGLFHSCKACMDKRTNRNNHKKQAARRREKLIEEGATMVCSKCGKEKPVEDFPKNVKAKNGVSSVCKECRAEARKATEQKKLDRAEQERLYMIEREMTLRKGRENFFNFCQILAPDFYRPERWHLWLLCNTLQALYERHLTKKYFRALCTMPHIPKWLAEKVIDWDRLEDGKVYTKLMINMSPRSGKSRSLTMFADWLLGKSKDNRIITVSYNTDLAANMSRYVRDGIMQQKVLPTDIVYADIFPDTRIAKGNAGFMKWSLEGSFFNYLGTGMEGTLTGTGGNCLLEGTLVLTNKGEVPIEQVYANKDDYLVPSLNLDTKMIEYKRIIATRKVESDEILKFKTDSDREIACTKEHRLFDGRGFREAGTFRKGDCLYGLSQQEKQKLCDLWQAEGRQGTDLPRLLYRIEKIADKADLCALRSRVFETNARLSQSLEKQYDREDVLFTSMCEHGAEGYNKATDLHCLRKETSHGEEVLFTDLPRTVGGQKQKKIVGQSLPNLQKDIPTSQQSDNILFKGVRKQGTFCENDRQGESKVYRRSQLRSGVLESKREGLGEGQSSMLDLRKAGNENQYDMEREKEGTNQYDCSSYRPKYSSQQHEEFDYCMRYLPSEHTSSVRADKIISIERVSGEKYPCYDLQIEDNKNFIANNLVVHNCLICDDLVKNANEAYNERVLDDIWNWYVGTFMSRSEHTGQGSIELINFTRWSTHDLCGRILESPMGKDWANLIIPVEYEGEIYCEDILPREEFERLREGMDTNIFEANYYQKPLDVEGRLFGDLKTYDTLPEGIEKIIAYCDTADEGSDYLACIVGVVKDGEGFITDIYYTQDTMQITEPATAEMLVRNHVNSAKIESNNGGKGFARNVEQIIWDKYHTKQVNIEWFHQTENKMARILTGSTFIQNHVYFPEKWDKKWPDFYKHVMGFSKDGKNKHDDGVEALVEWGKMITGDGSVNSYIEYMKRLAGVRV
jgi:predicted phage terminase large subunit-like protein